jgi:REP element-mobilizing transposase RayT
MTYLITFTCYGSHLHGHESGSVDRTRCLPGSPPLETDPKRAARERRRMNQPPYEMDRRRREAVLAAIRERCGECHWRLLAAHVRASHVHIVVETDSRPERVMNDLKSYASRRLNGLGLDAPTRKRWTRHGSTRWLWKPEHVSAAIQYVVCGQGEAMVVYEASEG